jgi:hypothetical protein
MRPPSESELSMRKRCSLVVLTTVLLLAGVDSSASAADSYVGAKKYRPCHLKFTHG